MKFLKHLKPILTSKQIERLSNIFDNAGQVVFGVVVLSPLIAGIENINGFVILAGIGVMIVCWVTSLSIIKR